MDLDYSGRIVVRRQRKHSLVGRFLKKILVSETRFHNDTPCWEWQAGKDDSGYGRFSAEFGECDKEHYAHRVSYRMFIGEIPVGYEVDHDCRNRACSSPFHLIAITQAENLSKRDAAKTHCKFGHELTPDNLCSTGCKKCRYRRVAEWRARHPERARHVYRTGKIPAE